MFALPAEPHVYCHNIILEPCQTCTAVRNMQQQQDAAPSEGLQHQANGSFVNDKTLDDLGSVRLSNRSHTKAK
jgi:predicted transcriptional regulator